MIDPSLAADPAVYVQLFVSFFKTGLFAIGGGLATLPFLYEMAVTYPWMTPEMIPDMIAISESTPGALGVNMATYAGYNAAGIPGAITATAALVLPSVIVIILISRFFPDLFERRRVKNAMYVLRPTVLALVAAVGWKVLSDSVFSGGFGNFSATAANALTAGTAASLSDAAAAVSFPQIAVFLVLFCAMRKKGGGMIPYILLSAALGILLGL